MNYSLVYHNLTVSDPTMRLSLLLYITFLKVVQADDLSPTSGYVGESVTLPSGANESWELSRITWSIYTNTTWIATYLNNKINENYFYRYRGRLTLNKTTGNLVIKNLTGADEMVYTVVFLNKERMNKVNKIRLTVKQHLRNPEIQTTYSQQKDGCLMALRCVSPDNGVTLSWNVDPPIKTVSKEMEGNANCLVAFLSSTQTAVKFTCISSKNMDNTTRARTLKCEDEHTPVTPPKPTTGPSPDPSPTGYIIYRDPVFLVPGFFICFLIAACVYCLNKNRKYTVTGSENP